MNIMNRRPRLHRQIRSLTGGRLRVGWPRVLACLGVGALFGFAAEIYAARQPLVRVAAPVVLDRTSLEHAPDAASVDLARELVKDHPPGDGALSAAASSQGSLDRSAQGRAAQDLGAVPPGAEFFSIDPSELSAVAFAQSSASSGQETSGIPTTSLPDYPAAGIDAGVYNEGQAAFWDLPLVDFFKFFGPEQRAQGYRPEQPINFSHIVHVQQNKMECQYCHWSVTKGSYAALPDVESCMGCHKLVKGRDPASQAEIKKLEDYYGRGEAIPWVKVHVMPNHYKFNHKRHVKAGVSCQECHGQVGEMPVVERVSSMKMGWCVSCHRERGTSIDCATCHH